MAGRVARVFLAFLFLCGTAWGQYPSRAIRLYVPNPPGGATDTLARVVAPRLAEALGQAVIVENRPGSNGNLAMEATARAAPDGYTLLLCADAQIVIGPHLYAHMPIDTLKDLDPVATLVNTQMVLTVSPALPVRPRAVESSVTPAPSAKLKSKRLIPPPIHRSLPYANDQMNGVPVGNPVTIDWRGNVNAPASFGLPVGDWPSGVYFVRLQSDDGRLGFAPFILRPAAPSARVAVVMPTNTWQAYNFYDGDGDGFGDSWYVTWATASIDLTRPHLLRGVPYRFRSYDLAFLHWLAQGGKQPDFYADDDLTAFASGDDLRSAYDLIIFPGHEEYVTAHAYDVIERYRDAGGNLAFLSSNNFFRRVEQRGDKLALVGLWRDLGRPEAALLGTEYRASDRGTHQSPFVITPTGAASWAFAGTGLAAGSTFGRFGIEIDATARSSPPGVQVLAEIPDALGPGLTAQMTYYETAAGARVFSAGVLNFAGEALLWPETAKLLENVWDQLSVK